MIPVCTVFSWIFFVSSSRYTTIDAGHVVGDHVGVAAGVVGVFEFRIGLPRAAHTTHPVTVAIPGMPVLISITAPVAAPANARAALHFSPSHCAAVDTVLLVPIHPFDTPVAIAQAIAAHVAPSTLLSTHLPLW